MSEKLLLLQYFVECGRMGDLDGLFVCTEAEMKQAIGQEVYWGEVLGKHSEIYHDLSEEHLTLKSEDQDFIAKLVELLGRDISGFNPIAKILDKE